MTKKFNKGTPQYELFNDFWTFCQKYYEADDDASIDSITKASTDFYNKYKGTELEQYSRELILAHLNDVDRRFRNGRDKQRS